MHARTRRGSVMIHVLVTSVVSMVIAAGLMRIVMMRYVAIQRVQDGGATRRSAEAALSKIMGVWNANGRSCSNSPTAVSTVGFAYTVGPDVVGPTYCTCSLNDGAVTITASDSTLPGQPCNLTIVAP